MDEELKAVIDYIGEGVYNLNKTLIERNELLDKQNDILEKQNDLLEQIYNDMPNHTQFSKIIRAISGEVL